MSFMQFYKFRKQNTIVIPKIIFAKSFIVIYKRLQMINVKMNELFCSTRGITFKDLSCYVVRLRKCI